MTPQNQRHKTGFISQHPPTHLKPVLMMSIARLLTSNPRAHFKPPSECHSSLSLFVHKCDVEHRLHSSPCSPRDPWILAFLPPFWSGLYTAAGQSLQHRPHGITFLLCCLTFPISLRNKEQSPAQQPAMDSRLGPHSCLLGSTGKPLGGEV